MPHFSSSALLFARPLQGATVYALPISTGSKFLLTRPSRGATILYLILCIVYSISTHTPLAGRDCNNLCLEFLNKNFYSHAPRGARLPISLNSAVTSVFLLTRPSRGATATFSSRSVGARHILGRTWFFAGISSTRRPVSREKPNIFRRTSRHFPVIAPSPDGIRLCFPRGYRIYASAHPHQITSHSCHAVILL